MAQKIVTELIDDVDGSVAEETVEFSYRGYSYEIDLSSKNIQRLDKALNAFIEHARRTGRTGRQGKATVSRIPSNSADVRAWAEAEGYDVPARGRIPNALREAYEAAQAS